MQDIDLIPANSPETKESGNTKTWEKVPLRDVCLKITDGTHDTPIVMRKGVPFLTAIHVQAHGVDYENCLYISQSAHQQIYKRCNPERNDILLVNIGGGVGTSAVVEVDYEFSIKNVALLKPNPRKVLGIFLNQVLRLNRARIANSLLSGGAQPFLSLSQIGQIPLSLPPLAEQRAIATALSDMDALIAAQEKLIAKKRDIKTATLQQLITGRKRLPGFGEGKRNRSTDIGFVPEDWRLSSIAKESLTYSGGTPPTHRPDYYAGDIPWITSADLRVQRIHMVSGGISLAGLINSSAKMVEPDTVLLALYGATAGVVALTKIRAAINQAVLAIVPKKLSAEFLLYWLNLKKDRIVETFTQGGQPNLSGQIIRNLIVAIPPIPEQRAIAEVLSDMDNEITALEARLSKLRDIKQGMMQELLTGRTRLV